MKKVTDIILALALAVLMIFLSVIFTVNFKQLYYYDANRLQLAQKEDISFEEIKLNYDYLVKYNLSREEKEFDMPTINYSKEGKIHFEEVRIIVQNIIDLMILISIVCIISIFLKLRNKEIEFMNITSKFMMILPIILAIPIVVDFDRSFVIFHEILFDNDYWIFNPVTDPVINILPAEFFMHAGMLILLLIFTISVILKVGYFKLKKRISDY